MNTITLTCIPKFSSLSLLAPYRATLNTTLNFVLKCGYRVKHKTTYFNGKSSIFQTTEELVLEVTKDELHKKCSLLNNNNLNCRICKTF